MRKFISHVQVPTNNLEDSIHWYVKCLGGSLVANFGEFAIIDIGEGPNINLWKTTDRTTSTFTIDGKPFPTVGIEVENIDRIINMVIESGTDYEGDGIPVVDQEGRKFFRFFDPTGNMIVVHEEQN
ncbi:VOC family protein [Paenibacillus silvae]|uniref:VOC domain-containing protein n=1 Tax=Paenibacillus silvae TaxID=1325358 RepID=A0A2W6NCC6_9BACL|nr:VOC family protein [Paenibacillus silvae]PZT53279.1 hypothetical protein DN757_23490 [Paenibacillus silvae]